MRRFLLLAVFAICAGAPAFSQTARSTRYVSVQSAAIKDSNSFFAGELGNLSLGDAVTLIEETTSGKWSLIRSGETTGWVTTASLSVRRIVASGTSASSTEIALAGKGFSPEIEMEYRKTGLDYSMVEFMEKISIQREELLGFITDGRLAKGEK
jgi:hypothetical protein